MKKFVATLVFLLLAAPAWSSEIHKVTAKEARNLLARKNLFVLDVRTPEEYRDGRLKGSVLIPVAQLLQRSAEVPRNRGVLVYCAVGGRSRVAALFLSAKGYPEVYDMTDGMDGWQKNGFPVDR